MSTFNLKFISYLKKTTLAPSVIESLFIPGFVIVPGLGMAKYKEDSRYGPSPGSLCAGS